MKEYDAPSDLYSLRASGSGGNREPVATARAHAPDVGIDDEMVDIDRRGDQQHALGQPEADEYEGIGPAIEQTVAERQTEKIEVGGVIESSSLVVRQIALVLYVEYCDDDQILQAVEDGRPEKGTQIVEYDSPDTIGEHDEQAN